VGRVCDWHSKGGGGLFQVDVAEITIAPHYMQKFLVSSQFVMSTLN
jgi:hypothetical protein